MSSPGPREEQRNGHVKTQGEDRHLLVKEKSQEKSTLLPP